MPRSAPARGVLLVALVVAGLCALAPTAPAQQVAALGPQVRLSAVGADGPGGTAAGGPGLTRDPQTGHYLVTFSSTPPGANVLHREVFAQLLDAEGGRLGSPVQVSQTGDPSDFARDAGIATPVYNPAAHEFLVVFQSNKPPLLQGDAEVFGRLLDQNGTPLGPGEFQISNGPGLRASTGPTVALNAASNEYLVAWAGGVDDDYNAEIFVRRLDSAGTPVGAIADRISTTGTAGAGMLAFFAAAPSIAYNPLANEYLVTWYADRDPTTATQKFEINGQRLSASGNQLGGTDDLTISQTGAPTDTTASAIAPDAAFDPVSDQYLVAFQVHAPGLPAANDEIFEQRLAPDGTPAPDGTDVRLTDASAPNEPAFNAKLSPFAGGGLLLTYLAAPGTGGLPAGKREVFAQRLGTAANAVGGPARVSQTGVAGDANADAINLVLTPGPGTEALAAWQADPGTDGLATDEFEIFGRRVGLPAGSASGQGAPPSMATRAPRASFKLRRSYRLSTVLRRGLSVTVSADEASTITAAGDIARRAAKALGLARASVRVIVMRSRRATLPGAGRKKITLRFTAAAKRRLRHARQVTLTVRVTVRDRAGNTTRVAHATKLRR